ncbi:MAG TPA: PEP-CTERM sorting domain-containing protein [Casimicrobiaceae bacterium]|nr:PEP-CTERM sorting domain-containing protein [Casimicrobiaceae bacterium]
MLAVAALMGSAEAKIVGSGFDPPFFDGFGHFLVPDPPSPCLTLSPGFHFIDPGFQGCDGVSLQDVTVNVDDGLGDSALLTLASPSELLFGMVLDPSAHSTVVGIDSFLIPLSCTDPLGSNDLCSYDWFIQWVSIVKPTHSDPLHGLFNEVLLFRKSCAEDGDGWYGHEDCNLSLFGEPATHVSFTPEPGSLALLGGALAAGWLARRRRSTR